jgi:hypothetical protein
MTNLKLSEHTKSHELLARKTKTAKVTVSNPQVILYIQLLQNEKSGTKMEGNAAFPTGSIEPNEINK